MEFKNEVITTYKNVNPLDKFDGKCPFCNKSNLIIRSSRIREVPDMGTTMERIIARIKEPRMKCNECASEFVVHHPFYPPKYEYSKSIIEYALTHYHYKNTSGNEISSNLKTLHQVNIPEDTIYTWLKEHSPNFLKVKLDKNPHQDLSHVKSITIDGSYVSTGKDIIGKKKHVDSLSVTKLENGDYLLMWWE